jgi:hypothetical protein
MNEGEEEVEGIVVKDRENRNKLFDCEGSQAVPARRSGKGMLKRR